ncbi:MAG TPA: hypothetical protein DEV93_19115, partial [Chloroflexi bacterium]|nr:hypothetical protein [Chloroflexota bacterium]
DDSVLGTVEAYDPATNSWSTKAAMPSARWGLAATIGPDGKIYAIGGVEPLGLAGKIVGTVEAYAPSTNSWGALTPLTVSVKLAHGRIKAGQKQTVSVMTAPNVRVTVVVKFPDGSRKTRTGTANSEGKFTWSFKQPPGRAQSHNLSAKVTVTVKRGDELPKSASKQYRIA